MMKKGYLKSLSAAVLASVLVLSSTLCVAAEEPGDVNDPATVVSSTDVFGNDVSGGDVAIPTPEVTETPAPTATPEATATPTPEVTPVPVATATPAAEKTKLDTPTQAYWGKNFTACWTTVPDAQGQYDVQLLYNNEVIDRFGLSTYHGGQYTSWELARNIEKSGSYQFKVRASNDYDPDHTEDSDWISSEVKEYNRPDAQLGTTKGYWDTTTPGILHFSGVKDAFKYEFVIYYKKTIDSDMKQVSIRLASPMMGDTNDQEIKEDFTDVIGRKGEGLYAVTIRALSGNLDTIANGETGELSEFYNTSDTSATVNKELSEALTNTSASDALQTITNKVSKDSLKTAMQTDSKTQELVKELESRYTNEKSISVQDPKVSEDAASYVDAKKIAMVGAGLNAAEGSNVQLTVGIPEKQEYVSDKHYKNTVQLAIELKNNDTSVHELAVPITITMPIPAGLNENRLAILHYHENGSVESVTLKNNGDGTVTFTVTDFSTFVFAEKAEATDDSNNSNGSDSSESTIVSDGTASSGSSNASYDWNDMSINVDWSAAASKLDTAVQAADGTNVNVLTGKDVKVSADILKKIAGKNVTLALQAGNGVAFSVSGQNNKQIRGALDLTVTNKDTAPAQVKNTVMAGALSSRNILITENSPLQTRISLHVGLATEYAGKYANLYYYDAKSGQMKLVGIYQINKDGQSMFALTHGGQYLVTVTDAAAKGVAAEGYTVVSGDTMSRIAVKMGTTLRALKAANPQIADINKIRPGQVIKIQ